MRKFSCSVIWVIVCLPCCVELYDLSSPVLATADNLVTPFFLDNPDAADSTLSSYGEQQKLEIDFEHIVPVTVFCDYPRLYGHSSLIDYVNDKLKAEAEKRFYDFIEQENAASAEDYDIDFGDCSLEYRLFPVCCSGSLVSICCVESQSRACPHGWSRYDGRNYWQYESAVLELRLQDLFVKGSDWCNFLIDYCEEACRCRDNGRYTLEPEQPTFSLHDLERFVLTENQIVIFLQCGADGSDWIGIPYKDLGVFLAPDGPLSGFSDCECNRRLASRSRP